ncbi:MAG: hypothetical protein E6J41_13540 [Chloroflexi bacterium]|nr:MAG: hypothetical protein E6J41_13540 [Chloroflexota bacterium]
MLPNQVDRILDQTLFRNLSRERLRPRIGSLKVRQYAAGEIVAEPTLRHATTPGGPAATNATNLVDGSGPPR